MVLGHLSLLIISFCVLLGLGWLGRGVWLQRKGRRLSALPVRISLFLYGLSYVVMLILLNGEGNHLGVVSPQSITVFVTSVLGPLAALGVLSSYKQISGRLDLLIMSVATSSAMLVVGYLGVWGLIGFQTWA